MAAVGRSETFRTSGGRAANRGLNSETANADRRRAAGDPMLTKSKTPNKTKRILFAVLSLSLLCAAIAAGFANRISQRLAGSADVPVRSEREARKAERARAGFADETSTLPPVPQSTPQFEVSLPVIAGGGGTSTSTDGSLKVVGTIGQPAVGTTMSNGQFSQTGGFWQTQPGATPTPGSTVVQFSASNYGVGEGGGSVTITVNRTGDTSGASSVAFATSDGSAKQALDYVATSGTLSFGSSETSKTFNVSIVDDALFDPNETLNLTLSNATGATLAAPSTATITITDNDIIRSKKTGVFRPSTGELFLKNANSSGFADTYIIFGNPGDYPVAGDWNGDGVDSVGIYRNGVFYLRNTNTTGFADIVVPFGNPGDQPVVGDWNGDGVDTIGIYRNGNFILRNSNTAGPPDLVFTLGDPGDVGIAGDWNGDGIVTCGVFRPSNGIVYLKNSNTTGFADLAFVFGNAGDKPVAGDWNGDGTDTVGIYRDGLFYLTNSNTTGFADIVFVLGNSGDFPIAGNWNGSP